ncbi:hypothetical protein N9D31_01635 [Oligoflexaceae bacterium]|nr:hypothetical protein [Oligoflexaceae bacterium]
MKCFVLMAILAFASCKARDQEERGESPSGANLLGTSDSDSVTAAGLNNCFDTMPSDREAGPFFKVAKTVSSWRGRQRTSTERVPIDPPEQGLNICRTVSDECIACTPWRSLYPNDDQNENLCDDYAQQCSIDSAKPCECVRS